MLKEDLSQTPVKSVRAIEKPVELKEIKTDKGTFVAESMFVANG